MVKLKEPTPATLVQGIVPEAVAEFVSRRWHWQDRQAYHGLGLAWPNLAKLTQDPTDKPEPREMI